MALTADELPTRLLLISQPSTPGLTSIPATEKETCELKDIMEGEHVEYLWLNHEVATTA